MIDTWGANTIGVYNGFYWTGNDEISFNLGSFKENDNRGVQLTDEERVATFDISFPGHHDGHAAHNYTLFPLDTYSCGSVSHLG